MTDQTIPPLPKTIPAKTSALAITSLVLGILGLFSCGVTAFIGLILGIIAMVKVQSSGGKLKGFGLALAGTIVSALFVFMIPIFAAMLLPALAAAKQRAQEINCVNSEKTLVSATRMYSDDHTNSLPPSATWCDAIKPFVGSEKSFQYPGGNPGRCDFAFNAKLDGMAESKVNPETVMIFESDSGWNASGGREIMSSHLRNGRIFVVALADGSIQTVNQSQLDSLRWDP
ncbi:MAG TPA: DUF4190 domain-containing protein [Verrucomicrobiae bacterium]|nr:DUF4190 domain-containing protein [Verrucomicrobiae bacterium]